MIETFECCDPNSCLHYECKDILIEDVRMVWQTIDTLIYVADSVDGLYQRHRKNGYISASGVFAS